MFNFISIKWDRFLNEARESGATGALLVELEQGSTKSPETVGDLRKIIRMAKARKAGGTLGKRAAQMLIGAVPGGGAVLGIFAAANDAKNAIQQLYGMEDKLKTGTTLDRLNVDDDISKIVDNPIEMAFLNWLIGEYFKNARDEDPIPDTTVLLKKWLKAKFNQRTVTGDEPK